MAGLSISNYQPVSRIAEVVGSRYAGLEGKQKRLIDENITNLFKRGRTFADEAAYEESVNSMRQILSNPATLRGLERSATDPTRNPKNHEACR